MVFPPKIAEQALIDCGRRCSLCHKFCGTKMELHHITPGGEDTYENCVPLCFDCHAEVQHYNPSHPKGRKLTAAELKGHRNAWYQKIKDSAGCGASPDHLGVDRRLFTEIREVLPSTGSIAFIRKHDYAGSFHKDDHQDFQEFLTFCDRPEVEFLDSDLESLRARLVESVGSFIRALGANRFPTHEKSYYSVPSEWEWKEPERFRSALEVIHKGADQLCAAYDELIRSGRRRLGIF